MATALIQNIHEAKSNLSVFQRSKGWSQMFNEWGNWKQYRWWATLGEPLNTKVTQWWNGLIWFYNILEKMLCSALWSSLFESRKQKPKKGWNYKYISTVITGEHKELLKLKGNTGIITNGYKFEVNIPSLRIRIGFLSISVVEPLFSASTGNTSPS